MIKNIATLRYNFSTWENVYGIMKYKRTQSYTLYSKLKTIKKTMTTC